MTNYTVKNPNDKTPVPVLLVNGESAIPIGRCRIAQTMSPSRARFPLIPESLVQFYRRMRNAFRMPPSKDAIVISKLSRVVELHHRAAIMIHAVEESAPAGQEHLGELCTEETRLAHAVGDLVTELGGSPPRPEESSLELPRETAEMSYVRDQAELMSLVRENIDFAANAHLQLARSPEIPSAMRDQLSALLRGGTSA